MLFVEVLLIAPRTVPKTSSGKLRAGPIAALYLKGELGGVSEPRSLLLMKIALALAEAAPALGRTLAVAGRWAYGL